jgi:geranylgeranyl diphosphate synthase type II
MDLPSYLKSRQALINRALTRCLPSVGAFPGQIHQAMRYSVLGEGKRIRPILALAACEAVGGTIGAALPAACALELIHAYSLVHDDLPAMDNDDFRRGKPSCHKQFGEAIGILTGDALLTYSFELLTQGNKPRGNGESGVYLQVIREIAQAIGTRGMIGGQVADVDLAKGKLQPKMVDLANRKKTGALISASVRVGALLGGATPAAYRRLKSYGDRVGFVFQLVDDLLDQDGAASLYGSEVVHTKARRLTGQAIALVAPFGKRAQPLAALAQFILTRDS